MNNFIVSNLFYSDFMIIWLVFYKAGYVKSSPLYGFYIMTFFTVWVLIIFGWELSLLFSIAMIVYHIVPILLLNPANGIKLEDVKLTVISIFAYNFILFMFGRNPFNYYMDILLYIVDKKPSIMDLVNHRLGQNPIN